MGQPFGGKPGSAISQNTEQAGMLKNYGGSLRSKIDQDEKDAKLEKHIKKKKDAMDKGADDSGSDAEAQHRKNFSTADGTEVEKVKTKVKKAISRRVTGNKTAEGSEKNEDNISRANSRASRVITPVVFDSKQGSPRRTKGNKFDVEEKEDKDPKMNHPHIKGGGTLFMGAHIHKDLNMSPGMKFTDPLTAEVK